MLITLCYSVLTWIQSRQRSEISAWVTKSLLQTQQGSLSSSSSGGGSIVCFRKDFTLSFSLATWTPSNFSGLSTTSGGGNGDLSTTGATCNNDHILPITIHEDEDESSAATTAILVSNNFSPSIGTGSAGTGASTRSPSVASGFAILSPDVGETSISESTKGTSSTLTPSSTSNLLEKVSAIAANVLTRVEVSDLCQNFQVTKLKKILWEEETTRSLIVTPTLSVHLHDWISFKEDPHRSTEDCLTEEDEEDCDEDENDHNSKHSNSKSATAIDEEYSFLILLEAESNLPQAKKKAQSRKFAQFGKLVAWRYNNAGQFALIIRSDLNQLIDLMHIFRLGIFLLEGGWKVHRLSTVQVEGTAGTLISWGRSFQESKKYLTPGDLRKLSVGLYDCRESDYSDSLNSTPKSTLSKNISKHDITTICEEPVDEQLEAITTTPLGNWFERSPKLKPTVPSFTKSTSAGSSRRRFSSFIPGCGISASSKSSSNVSLKLLGKSTSVDEDIEPEQHSTKVKNWITSSKSYESLTLSTAPSLPTIMSDPSASMNLLSPEDSSVSRSLSSSPRRLPHKKNPSNQRVGKPNILILSDCEAKSDEIGNILKKLLSRERYAVYNIRWDQLEVGGWSEQTALLVVSGHIPKPSFILEYLGDGGRLLCWCCEEPPFGPGTLTSATKGIIEYGPNPPKITRPVVLTGKVWGVPTPPNKQPPELKKVLETVDSEGYARPLTVSVYATLQGTKAPVVVQLDGGALGGKAFLSQILFEKSNENEDALTLLSVMLGQNLGIDCSQVGGVEFSEGYLLGDHRKVMDFLSSVPTTVEQSELTLEFIPRGEKGSRPSHLRLPIYTLMCPPNFSTLHYYDNLDSKTLGRVVIYVDTLTSTMNVFKGHSLMHGLTVIAARQTSGKGRGKNVWLSPEGCAVFTVQICVPMNSAIGQRISLIQHLAALAAVLAVPNHTELRLGVKWPNDIYAGEDKIGGVLVESKIEGQKAIVNIGIGINVSNNHPTVCLSSLMCHTVTSALENDKKGKSPIRVETVIAKTLTKFEELLEKIEKEPVERILELYQQNWIHSSDDEINVEITDGMFTACRILGVDEYGFLRAVQLDSGNVFSVQPDGNSFDITNKLVAIKR